MRNPNDDSLLDQVVSLCCLSRYIDERESLYFSVLRICARNLSCELFCQIILVPAMQENAGIDGFIFPTLGISLRETAREN